MSNPSEDFACRWQASRALLLSYLGLQGLALGSLAWVGLPLWLRLLLAAACLLQAAWALPRHLLLSHPSAIRGLRRDAHGWSLWSPRQGWQPVQLMPDSLALPALVVLRYRHPGRWRVHSLWIAGDALDAEQHRRLRLRLKFSRNRWAAAE